MGTFIEAADLAPFATIDPAKANAMIADAEAMAVLVAPCLADEDFTQQAAAKAVLRGALLRWNEAGSGALQAQAAGPFSNTLDTRQERKAMFWPSEIEQLQGLCSGLGSGLYSTSLAGEDGYSAYAVPPDWTSWS